MVELLFLCTLSRGMKDCFLDTLFSLGKACVKGEETLIRSCIYIKRKVPVRQALKSIFVQDVQHV